MLTFRYSNRQQSVPVRIMLVPKSELKKKAKNLKHVLYINVQKARSVHRFAAQLNLTNNPDRSSLVQFYLGPFNESCGWIYEYFCFYFSQEPRNRTDPRQTQNKRFMKSKDTDCYCKCCCNTISAVSLRVSLLCLLHGIVFGTQTLWIHVFV